MDNGDLKKQTSQILLIARKLAITKQEEYLYAASLLPIIAELEKKVDARYDPVIKATYIGHKAALKAKREDSGPLAEAKQFIKVLCASWVEAQEHARRLAEAKLRVEAKEQEESRLLEEAAALEAVDPEAAGALLEQAQNVEVYVSVGTFTPKIAGVSYSDTWDFEIVDESKIPREYLMLDLVRIRKTVGDLKGRTDIPGVRVFARKSVTVKASTAAQDMPAW